MQVGTVTDTENRRVMRDGDEAVTEYLPRAACRKTDKTDAVGKVDKTDAVGKVDKTDAVGKVDKAEKTTRLTKLLQFKGMTGATVISQGHVCAR